MEQPRSPSLIALAHQTGHSLELTISQVGHPRLEVSKKAIAQLLPVFKDRRVMNFMMDRVDVLLSTVVTQLRKLQSLLPSEQPEKKREISLLYYQILGLIAAIFKVENSVLIRNVSKSTFCELLYVFISIMTDPETELIPNGKSILQTMNVLVLQIIETPEPHCVICGLLGLLNLAVQMTTNKSNLMNIVLKCEAKLLKQFAQWKENEKIIADHDMESIIREFNSFISKHSYRITTNTEDSVPIKTMRVILKRLFMFSGSQKIFSVMDKMPDLKGTKTESFVRKTGNRRTFSASTMIVSGEMSPDFLTPPTSTRISTTVHSVSSSSEIGTPIYNSTPIPL